MTMTAVNGDDEDGDEDDDGDNNSNSSRDWMRANVGGFRIM